MKKKKNEKPKEKMFRVTMEMTEDHIRATCDALEAAWRTAMGQTEYAITYAEFTNPLDYYTRQALANIMKAILFPQLGNNELCAGKKNVPPGANMAYEVGRQLAHVMWVHDESERKASGCDCYACVLEYPAQSVSGLPFPKIKIEEIK